LINKAGFNEALAIEAKICRKYFYRKYRMIYYLPLFLTIIGSLFYHISQKFTSNNINPIFSIMVSYLVALLLSGIMLIFYKNNNTFVQNIKELNWTAFILGIAIVLVELGFLFVYCIGWDALGIRHHRRSLKRN
jgi:hypothetical protein